MCTRLIYLILFVLALFLAGNVQAQDATWTDASGDHNWFTTKNWSDFPTPAHWVKIRNGLPGPTIASGSALASRVHIGYKEGGALTMDGGTLDISGDDLLMGKSDNTGTLNMNGGTITVARDLEVAGGNPGFLNMTGGTIIVGDDFEIPESEGDGVSIAQVHLDGGSIIIGGDLHMFDQGSLDIAAGTLILAGNVVSTVQGYIDSGWITAYGGNGTVQLDYNVTNEGQTTLKGVHKLKPNPANGDVVAPGTLELSWTLPDPCVPGQPVLVDVYFTDNWEALYSFADPASIRVVTKSNVTSVIVQAAPKTQYYWAVDTYVGDPNDPILGPIFSFVADNQAPQVDAGRNTVTWLLDGSRTGKLDATVIDEDACTVKWTVVSEPAPGSAIIQAATAEDTSVTFSATGQYVLQLDASDGEYTGSDTVTIDVYNDSCEAAQSLPGYQPLVGDLNGDCRVDDTDLALLQQNWLQDNSLTQDWFPLP